MTKWPIPASPRLGAAIFAAPTTLCQSPNLSLVKGNRSELNGLHRNLPIDAQEASHWEEFLALWADTSTNSEFTKTRDCLSRCYAVASKAVHLTLDAQHLRLNSLGAAHVDRAGPTPASWVRMVNAQ